MNLLAVDTATEKFSVALSRENSAGNNTMLLTVDAGLRHSELLMDGIDALLKTAGLRPEELSGVVCSGGPGSFTGLRIGFALSKGLALALNIPFTAIPTLDFMAGPFSFWPGMVAPVIDAKKGAFFCALYRDGKRLCPDMDASPAEIATVINGAQPGAEEPVLLVGPASLMLYEKIMELPMEKRPAPGIKSGGTRWGDAQTLLEIAKETAFPEIQSDYFSGPVYIRKSDAELNLQ